MISVNDFESMDTKRYSKIAAIGAWHDLDEDQKEEVKRIARQLPWAIEDVAWIYEKCSYSSLSTMQYLSETYGFIFLI